jgi:CRP/FNR family transcriptional regulator, cyclic AMP receptor protein
MRLTPDSSMNAISNLARSTCACFPAGVLKRTVRNLPAGTVAVRANGLRSDRRCPLFAAAPHSRAISYIVETSRRAWLAAAGSGSILASMAVSSPDLKAFLLATPFFGGLSDASFDLLVSMLVERRFDIGDTVVAEGQPGRSMFVVHSGELVVSKLGDSGRIIRMASLKPGDFFGEMTLIEMQNRSATVVAQSPTLLYELTARQLYTYYKADIYAYVMVMQNINRELCRRLRRADDRVAQLQMLHASQ